MSHSFCHLHCHTNYSLLDGTASIPALIQQTKVLGMQAIAITDHGNLYGVPHFVSEAKRQGIKPIIGCEFYLAADMLDRKEKKRYHQLLLAKNATGYQNLIKLSSLSFTEGYYYKPRIDRKCIQAHAEGLIATTCCLAAEVPRAILEKGEEAAEKIFLQWVEIFGEDYYIELQRHGIAEQEQCNQVLLKWSKKYNVKVIATNDVHYIKQEDSLAQDIMLCLQTGKSFNDPNRMRFIGQQFYLKSPQEMAATFPEVPEALENTLEIAQKVDNIDLHRDILMPIFQIPPNFPNQAAYLRHLAIEGAKQRYGNLSTEIQTRLNYELETIIKMGFPGYFLIVQDMVNMAKKQGIFVGPGRGSVAGSVVAYALRITDIDPLKYGLLFERFLNPERVSMPDIDIDFEDEGRQKVINYLVEKYGYDQVAHIITFNALGAKSAIRDVARVLSMPLAKADALAKKVPEKLGTTLQQAIAQVPAFQQYLKTPESLEAKVLTISKTLEGSPRHTSTHAAGVIIAPKKLRELLPIKIDKTTNLLVTQYEALYVEQLGMLKIDLLGLRTLSIIRDALQLVQEIYQKNIDIQQIPLDDQKTFQLYQEGSTIGVFQFESEGMRSYLQQLKPTIIDHLIAMNALYRPGPMENIPSYIARMQGKQKINYMHPALKEVLETTYGIPVYQEQIMKMAQIIADYTPGNADLLRRIMGKKKRAEMEKQEVIFIEGAQKKHQIPAQQAKEIFQTMSQFAEYGFNLSHSAAYTLLSYQTAYLKANYPLAYMAAILMHHQRNMEKITFFLEECKRMKLQIKGPDINKSQIPFSSDAKDTIRFGLAAIKGVGAKAVEILVAERSANGPYKDPYDLIRRLIKAHEGKMPIKKTLELLAMVGALDSLGPYHRKQYIHAGEDKQTWLEKIIRYEQKRYKELHNPQKSLFTFQATHPQPPPTLPTCTHYTILEQLKIEKEMVGFYITAHPMDAFAVEAKYLCNANTQNALTQQNKEITLVGLITNVQHRQSSKGSYFATFILEDFKGSLPVALFGDTYHKFRHLIIEDQFLYLKGKVQSRYGREDQWEYRPSLIEPLDTILEKYTKALYLHLPIQQISKELVDNLTSLLKKYQGSTKIHLWLAEPEEQKPIHTMVKKYQCTPSKKFFLELQQIQIPYSIKVN